jgi:hypothetical protein
VLQAVLLTTTANATTQLWGAPSASPLHLQALRFLLVRGGLAPITILLLVLQVCMSGWAAGLPGGRSQVTNGQFVA